MTLRDIRLVNDVTELIYPREQFYARERRSVPAARRFAAQSLRCWGLSDWARAGDVSLCVSELATNALLHGVPPGRGFLLRLRYDGDVVRVEVHDSGPGMPKITDETDGEGGRGLVLVAALADKWGVCERELGKVVWGEFERSAAPPPDLSRSPAT